MTAEQPSVAALVEIAQDIMDTRREHDVCLRHECFYPAVIQMAEGVLALTAALERAERELEQCGRDGSEATDNWSATEARAQKAEQDTAEAMALVMSHEGHIAKMEARAQKAEAKVEKWIDLEHKMMERATEAEEELEAAEAQAQKAGAVVEAARLWREFATMQRTQALLDALAALDEQEQA